MGIFTYICLYLVVSAFFCNWVIDNVYKRCENPHWQIQAHNPIMTMVCMMFGWLAFVPLFVSIVILLLTTGSLDNAFKRIADSLDNDE